MDLKKLSIGGLTFFFAAVAADLAIAGGLGMSGLHGLVIEETTQWGAELGWHVDWGQFAETGEFEFLDSETDPCLSQGGHWHGNGQCHIPDSSSPGDLLSEGPTPSEPAPEPPPLTFGG